ncbi:alpha/beta hydrolase [Clostridium sp. MCC353]|uniref:alpha/beta fold hydrolase n=1 Tax=Clostridium sp. MCC353 TaxID=2592646 RepID=UPI001C01CA15|nr:alpha/beta hydrolase [Clostridium sp. MCC353]MBT9778374.1 alpha/beta hydrolase [Clostridium sp. MCC353]
MRLMILYGVNCTKNIWDYINPYLSNFEIDYVEYPHDVTLNAKKVDDLTEWVYKNYGHYCYDAMIGHSLGGIVALQLIAEYKMKVDKIIYLDTNLKPANEFYRNLMTQKNMDLYGESILQMLREEREFYTAELLKSIQVDFDYTNLVNEISQDIYAIYGDRGIPGYPAKIQDLNLSAQTLNNLNLVFIHDACHMIMVENPEQLSEVIKDILLICKK